MTQDMKKDTILHTITKLFVRNGRTPVRMAAYSSALTCALRVFAILFMLVVGVCEIKAQDYSGTYYIAPHGTKNDHGYGDYNPNSPATNYYLCPTEDWIYYQETNNFTTTDNGQPFLTSYNCKDGVYTANKAIWSIEKSGNYYKIIHAVDRKYLVVNDKIGNATSGNRIRVHLQDADPGDKALFTITKSAWSTSSFLISPKGNSGWYLNVTQGNKNSLKGIAGKNDGPEYTLNGVTTRYVDGTIGLWNADEHSSCFFLEEAITIPTVTYSESDKNVTISSSQAGVRLYYTMTDNGTEPTNPTSANAEYTTTPIPTTGAKKYIIKAVAAMQIGSTTYYSRVKRQVVDRKVDPSTIATPIDNFSGITDPSGAYYFSDTFTSTGSIPNNIGKSGNPFKGYIDGKMYSISPGGPLFECVEDAIIKNVIISSANIDTDGDAGAIANVAKGDSRIYNCGVLAGSIGGDDNVGGIVGLLQGTSRVINCYSFASITGGDNVGGIVGNNDVTTASTKDDINTMIMNCMFYGNISGGTKRSPIFGGMNITNAGNLNGYNYYLYDDDVPYTKKTIAEGGITDYNCALAAEKDYLTRFEFFRYTLNSNRELAAWYATGDPNKGKGENCEMAKWVQDGTTAYPILKKQGYYRSFINYDDAPEGGSISLSYSGVTPKTGAPKSLTVYDKDIVKKHFNYHTVRLPYYCEVADDNYSSGVVTGWEITEMIGGTQGHFTTGVLDYSGTTHGDEEYPPYNFADRYCTDKDLYDVSGRVFSQGAYFDVPDGVTGITIKPHKATNVAYLADPTYDVSYPSGYGQANAVFVDLMGPRQAPTEINGAPVYTTFNEALTALGTTSGTVYDNAIVLVGNYHHHWGQTSPTTSKTKSFTIMSADFNNDCEPDYSFICQHGTGRQNISPIRFDFINSPGLGMVQKVETDNAVPKHGIWYPTGWFEVTNTALIQFTQFEYDSGVKNANSPLILLGGIYDQIVTSEKYDGVSTQYIHLGSNIYMPMFSPGIHTKSTNTTRHCPVSVTGGEFGSFYLTGMFNPEATAYTDNAECYINGGKFGEVAGAGQEKIKGDVTWLIDHADIENFYGGGINGENEITGNIFVEINNSKIGTYCGGPKFGNMHDDMTVTTKAQGSTFTKFFGAGYGGTSYNRKHTKDASNAMDYSWDTWVTSDYPRNYSAENKGIATEYEYELIPLSGGESGDKAGFNVGRFYNKWASLSKAQTKNVITTLTDCDITTSFFGGGNLGRVDGTITTRLKGCHVGEDVFGGGFSATAPTVKVFKLGAKMNPKPSYNSIVGIINEGKYPTGSDVVEYTWENVGDSGSPFTDTDGKHYIWTDQDLDALGEVVGAINLTIEDSDTRHSEISRSVYGGGDASKSLSNTTVTIKGNTVISGNVYGGGNKGLVEGSTTVNIEN